ncbi:unnamed protein product [Dibothriocephalus latus]|uniref:Uncharacterized protein n=1 Tax=Dibothriocephalus latus TaxID=60516 RepID=A0A3P6T556_DIBLA|nr:unnamed protein product [Dibothriocephalus latus]
MLATVDIDIIGPDMFTASRHAQSIAENFLNDVDDFQRASRDADRRAMSHFDVAPVRYTTYTPAVTVVGSRYPSSYPYGYLPAKTIYDRTYPYTYYYPGRYSSYPYYHDYVPASRYYYSDYYPKSYVTPLPSYYNYYTSRYYYPYNDVLPTSHLRASTGPKPNWECLSRPALTRRWWSSSDLLSDVVSMPAVFIAINKKYMRP